MRVFFNKVAGPQNCNFIKNIFQHTFFPVKFAKLLRVLCFSEHLFFQLLMGVSGFQSAILLKKRLRKKCFPVNFAKILVSSFLLTGHLRMTAS